MEAIRHLHWVDKHTNIVVNKMSTVRPVRSSLSVFGGTLLLVFKGNKRKTDPIKNDGQKKKKEPKNT